MGIGSFLSPISAVGDMFRTGASSAVRDARGISKAGMDMSQEMYDDSRTGMLRGLGAQEQLFNTVSDPAALASLYGDVFQNMGGGAMQPMVDELMKVVEQMLAGSGLRRSGTAATEAAKVPTDIGLGMVSQILGGLGNVAQSGLGYLGGASNAIGNFVNAGNLGVEAALGAAQQKGDMLSGLVSAGGSIGAAMLSDPRLKANIRKIGEHGDLNVYQWDWKEGVADNLGKAASMRVGFMSDEVKDKYPQHVHNVAVAGAEFDAVDYPGVLQEMAA